MSEQFTQPVSGVQAIALAPPMPSQKVSIPASVEWDHKGRVVRARFANGQVSQFRYDQQGSLYAFTYAQLAWSTTDRVRFTAVDQDNTYILEGTVEVAVDGTITVRRQGVCRSLRLNGMVCDHVDENAAVESHRSSEEFSPFDLLASVKPKNTDTLNRLTPHRPPEQAEQAVEEPAARALAERKSDNLPTVNGGTGGGADGHRKMTIQGMRLNRSRHNAPEIQVLPKAEIEEWLNVAAAKSVIFLAQLFKRDDLSCIAPALDVLADDAYKSRRVDEARLLHERCLQLRKKNLSAHHHDVGLSLFGLGTIYHGWGRYSEAETYLLEAVQLLDNGLRKSIFLHQTLLASQKQVGKHLQILVKALHKLAILYHENSQPALCGQLYDAAVHVTGKVPVAERWPVKPLLEEMASMCRTEQALL